MQAAPAVTEQQIKVEEGLNDEGLRVTKGSVFYTNAEGIFG